MSAPRKILTITPNPALDISGVVPHLRANEKCYVSDEIQSPGGNAINAARLMHRLGVPTLTSGFLGGSTGEELSLLLKIEGVPQNFVTIRDRTRINITVSNLEDHQQTRLSFPGPSISASEKKELHKFVSKNTKSPFLIVGGSLPKGFSVADLDKLIQLAQKHEMKVAVDCPGAVLKKLKSKKLLLLKPNLEEFQSMTGTRARTISQVKKSANLLLKKSTYICVSSVEKGALLISKNGCWFGRIPQVKIRSTVGAGDSMVGAMVAQISLGNPSGEDILRWGLAAAAATLEETGTKLGSATRIRNLYKKTKTRLA